MSKSKTKLTQDYIRRYVHQHNSFQGSVRMAQMGMQAIERSITATRDAKELADDIWHKLERLKELLKDRDDSKAEDPYYSKGYHL